ncbi:MAG: 6-pyruvoyl tetrahydropterin synthase family protein, partial [Candidatus Hadarchaeales archaeon]
MKIEVTKVGFSAAHFLIGHERCEHVHGHNWTVGVSVSGETDKKGMVIDFDLLKKILSEICAKYDHKLLLPGRSSHVTLESDGKSLALKSGGRMYIFPEQDVL